MARAQSAYKGLQMPVFHHTHTHTHARTHACTRITGDGLVEKSERIDKSVCRREDACFQFRPKRRERRGMTDEERKRVPDDISDVLKYHPLPILYSSVLLSN